MRFFKYFINYIIIHKIFNFYPPDSGEKSAAIGGNINTNAGGMRAVKYGLTRDYVMELDVVLPNDEIINVEGKGVKNPSGYAKSQYLCESKDESYMNILNLKRTISIRIME